MDQGCVLLVDDEEDLRASLTQGLELSGQTVMATGNPEDALERVTRDFYGVATAAQIFHDFRIDSSFDSNKARVVCVRPK